MGGTCVFAFPNQEEVQKVGFGVLNIALCVSTALLAGIVMSVTGFGSGAVAMSILPYFMPYSQSVALSGLCGFTTATIIASTNFKHINFRMLAPCAICGLLASTTAVSLSLNVKGSLMMKALGVVLVALAVYSNFFGGKIKIKPTVLNGAIAGAAGGACAGLFSVGGPPIAVYLLACTDDKDIYRATINAHFFCTSLSATITRFRGGIITGDVLHMWLFMIAGIAAGVFLGNKIFYRLNAKRLRLVVYTYLAISGLNMIFN